MTKTKSTVFNVSTGQAGSRTARIEISSSREIRMTVTAGQARPDERALSRPAVKAEPAPVQSGPAVSVPAARPKMGPDFDQAWQDLKAAAVGLDVAARQIDQARLALILFVSAVGIYLAVRLVGLTTFPAYFSFDEATPTLLASDFLRDGFRNAAGEFFPTFFANIDKYSLGTTVYLQLLPLLLFGRSEWAVRGFSVLVGTAGAIAVGLTLRDIYKVRFWWAGTLILSLLPAWFVLSRTGYETPVMVSFFAVALYFYLLYRQRDRRFLYGSIVFGALAFYTYSPGELIVVVTALLIVLIDLRFHWENRGTTGPALLLTVLLALPYLRFILAHPTDPGQYLKNLDSYWFYDISLPEKLGQFISHYAFYWNPLYWFMPAYADTPNDVTLYLMRGYGLLPFYLAPFILWGLWITLRNFRSGEYRALLVVFLVAPLAAAQVLSPSSITRALVMVIPVAILGSLGLDDLLRRLADRVNWNRPVLMAATVFVILGAINLYTCWDVLKNGPLWFDSYAAGEINYAYPLFYEINARIANSPREDLVLSPLWTLHSDVLARFFLGDNFPMRIASLYDFAENKHPIDQDTLFVVTPAEFNFARQNPKFTGLQILSSLAYPNGQPGFYFIRLNYSTNIDKILSTEEAQRRIPLTQDVEIGDQSVRVAYPRLSGGSIENAFDGDPATLMKTLEANPAVIELTFPSPIALSQIGLIHGSSPIELKVWVYVSDADNQPLSFSAGFGPHALVPDILKFGRTISARRLRLEIGDTSQGSPGIVHIWEITFK